MPSARVSSGVSEESRRHHASWPSLLSLVTCSQQRSSRTLVRAARAWQRRRGLNAQLCGLSSSAARLRATISACNGGRELRFLFAHLPNSLRLRELLASLQPLSAPALCACRFVKAAKNGSQRAQQSRQGCHRHRRWCQPLPGLHLQCRWRIPCCDVQSAERRAGVCASLFSGCCSMQAVH